MRLWSRELAKTFFCVAFCAADEDEEKTRKKRATTREKSESFASVHLFLLNVYMFSNVYEFAFDRLHGTAVVRHLRKCELGDRYVSFAAITNFQPSRFRRFVIKCVAYVMKQC